MPFCLSNAPASFQEYINKILAEKLDIFVIVYLDDILVYTEDAGQSHVDAVRLVLEQLRKHDFYANLKKCRFHQDEVRFFGFVVSAQGIRMEEERIEAVKAWVEPKSVRDIKVFLGFANFYRRFIKGFGKIAAPLTSMLKTTTASPKVPRKLPGRLGRRLEIRSVMETEPKLVESSCRRAKIQRIRQRTKILQSPKLQRPRYPKLPLRLGLF